MIQSRYISSSPPDHIHIIGIAGTGMSALAQLLVEAGYRVTGSDLRFDPPAGPLLERLGVEQYEGWDACHLESNPDLVVVGNVCRRDNPEAQAAEQRGLRVQSFPQLMGETFLTHRPSFVVAGTHGKTTTTSLLAFLLHATHKDPGFLIGGLPHDFGVAAKLGATRAPFVIEGDEYDSAFFEKTPKFWHYRPRAAILTSIEHDHIDIYPDVDAYRAAFAEFLRRLPEDGRLVAWAGDLEIRALAPSAPCPVRFYALEGDACGSITPDWMAAPVRPQDGAQPFDLYGQGSFCGRVISPLAGHHNLRNAVAALALAAEAGEAPLSDLITALPRFSGVARRQDLVGIANDIRVYDDFAHHPTAVRETLRALRGHHPQGALIAAYEPASATASRAIHRNDYPAAFAAADFTVLAPVARAELKPDERLDAEAVAADIARAGKPAHAATTIEELITTITTRAQPGDTIVLMSNRTFGKAHEQILARLATRHLNT